MMIDLNSLLSFVFVTFILVITPGPNMIYLVSRTISQGRTAGILSYSGITTGFFIYLFCTCLGLTAIFTAVPTLYTIVKLAGACYLGYLAWKTLKPDGKSAFDPDSHLPQHKPLRLYGMGLLTVLLNPKVALIYAVLIPQFIHRNSGPMWQQILLLGLIQITISILVNITLIIFAASISHFLIERPKILTAQKTISGIILGGFAFKMATDR